ncbi:3-oxoacyl-(acyl carrier protein) synthase [Parvularcula bermudensis HTCC2503]|uniref:3-oxoacyl-[acyl-carrier-protein] synthase 1 n=1 Tax=Parvularcula bermudensis (strain ATCC BAA-594 / HTCC2503 / KCTC 12087) TaxID=314260 RepID=E0TE08_PARBH|nr:beta-ketoacyl-ACP synthase I [Parvularcula bermudensis]ADM08829.1 3-oxoacyl-(acyl carrier protein) synthase [Parvularcula bermudensis HTCC2503]
MRRVVVTGVGIVSSIGSTVSEVLDSLRNGKSGLSFAPEMAEHGFKSQVHGRPQIDVNDLLGRKTRRFMGEGAAWNYIAMRDAIEDSGLRPEEVSHEMTGIVMGSGGPSTKTIVSAANTTLETGSPRKIGPFAVPSAMSSTNSATLAVPFEIKGLNYSISSACATSVHCVGHAYEQVAMGKQDVVFAGGGEDLDWTLSNMFDAMGAMSSKFNDVPEMASRAYDAARDGFVIAGGAATLVVEALDRALARGAKIWGEITGYAANSDGVDMVMPSGEGASRCIAKAISTVKQRIGYINTHGTATKIGDSREVGAIKDVFGDDIPPFGSTKSLTGHSLGAVGAQELIYGLIMMKNRFLAASAAIETLDPEFEGLPILRERQDNVDLRAFLSNSFGFGGTNACLAIERFDG